MDNETTMPALLTRPATLHPGRSPRAAGSTLYTIIFVLALMVLALALWIA